LSRHTVVNPHSPRPTCAPPTTDRTAAYDVRLLDG